MEDVLKIDKMLDYCDVLQLFVARDTLYLCLLYDDEPVCRYTGIRISKDCLDGFLQGKSDLRDLFLHPERELEYYDVVLKNGTFFKSSLSAIPLSEEKLPEAGYSFTADTRENVVINFPVKDRSLLTELVRKFGWACM